MDRRNRTDDLALTFQSVQSPAVIDVVGVDLTRWTALASSVLRQEVAPMLDPSEHERGARQGSPARRDRYLASHAAARMVLGAHLGVDPSEVRLGREACVHCGAAHGRPIVHGDPLHYSLSHCEDRALVAVSDRGPIGVDIERVRPIEQPSVLARGVADDRELGLIANDPDPSRAFLHLWVRKEAVVKATGEGIRAAKAHSFADGEHPDWIVVMVDVGYRHVAAVAAAEAGDPGPVTWLAPPWESSQPQY